MKPCAYCGRENQDDAECCLECGTTEFVDATIQRKLEANSDTHRLAQRTVPEIYYTEIEPDVGEDAECALCISCLFPNLPEADWCKRYGTQMSSTASILFPQVAIATGCVYRNAVERPTKPVVVAFIWFQFGLVGLSHNLIALSGIFFGSDFGPNDLLVFWLVAISTVVCLRMVSQVTRNYVGHEKAVTDFPS